MPNSIPFSFNHTLGVYSYDCVYQFRIKFTGILRFNLRGQFLTAIRLVTRIFGWSTNLFLSFCATLLTLLLTMGMPRLLCNVSLFTNYGASTIILSILDWNLCIILTLELAAVPHSCNTYVHIGFIMHLYSNNLFSIESCNLRPNNQYIFFS